MIILKKHMELHLEAKKCKICSKSFKKVVKLGTHMKLHHKGIKIIKPKKGPTLHKCDYCERLYQKKQRLKNHVIRNHMPKIVKKDTTPKIVKTYKCNNCDYKSRKKYNVDKHALSRTCVQEFITFV